MLTQHATFLDPQQAMAEGIVTQVAHLDRPANAMLLTMPLPNGWEPTASCADQS